MNGCGDGIGKSKGYFKLGLKVSPGAEAGGGGGGSENGLVEGGCPGEGRALGHV